MVSPPRHEQRADMAALGDRARHAAEEAGDGVVARGAEQQTEQQTEAAWASGEGDPPLNNSYESGLGLGHDYRAAWAKGEGDPASFRSFPTPPEGSSEQVSLVQFSSVQFSTVQNS